MKRKPTHSQNEVRGFIATMKAATRMACESSKRDRASDATLRALSTMFTIGETWRKASRRRYLTKMKAWG